MGLKSTAKQMTKNVLNQALNNVLRGIMKAILPYLLIILLVVLVVVMSIGGVSMLFSSHSNDLKIDIDTIKSMPDIDIIAEQSIINPKLLDKYMDAESKSIPDTMKAKSYTIENGVKSEEAYTLYLYNTAYPYRLKWQLLASLDSLDTPFTEVFIDESGNKVRNKVTNRYTNALTELAPVFEWGHGNYYQTVVEEIETVTEVKNKDVYTTDTNSQTITKKYPLPLLKSVKTAFMLYVFTPKDKDLLISNTGWTTIHTETKDIVEIKKAEEKKENPENDEEDDNPEEEIVGWEKTTIRRRIRTFEDTQSCTQISNTELFEEYMINNNISISDLYVIYGMIASLPDNNEVLSEYVSAMHEIGISQTGIYIEANNYNLPANWVPVEDKYLWPTPTCNKISSPYGMRIHPVLKKQKMHNGIDIPANLNEPILSVADGIVINISKSASVGNWITLLHDNNIATVYMHLSKFKQGLKVGDPVKRGDLIGLVGNTGTLSLGPHLHYEIRKSGIATDPMIYYIK
jgi:murein DD-endopeptidase MepM/ murein hydrolase activator NlpD